METKAFKAINDEMKYKCIFVLGKYAYGYDYDYDYDYDSASINSWFLCMHYFQVFNTPLGICWLWYQVILDR